MEKEWDIIEVLRHSRHDWLNKLQLIKGNMDLNRIERVKEIVEEIIIEAQQESKLSNIKLPLFASLLLTANWESHQFQLEYEVLGEGGLPDLNEDLLTYWTKSFFACLDNSVEPFQENHLSVGIEKQDEGARFFFDFRGIIKQVKLIEQFLADSNNQEMEIVVEEFSENEFALEIFMPVV
ncbi:sporulation initiation phosphotransferase B [Neobacillus terrae]|uniref:sporulation initiation phosphotransferase B n=1 Tax=Neobacillus terrae TaxID=3034837 RepID=UPI00140E0BBE|nr:sporulation initiation phosphotransferase B [Neobacillus terrae]NHM30461.1 sporulation protein [Neobacillus terrae]